MRTLIVDQGSCVSHFVLVMLLIELQLNWWIALFQQLLYCIRADSADSAISVTPTPTTDTVHTLAHLTFRVVIWSPALRQFR